MFYKKQKKKKGIFLNESTRTEAFKVGMATKWIWGKFFIFHPRLVGQYPFPFPAPYPPQGRAGRGGKNQN